MGQGLAIEEKAGALLQSLLLPKKAPDWYSQREGGGAARRTFPPAPPGSFKLLGHVNLSAPILEEEITQFYVECLGARISRKSDDPCVVELCLGASNLVFHSQRCKDVAAEGREVMPWQGHFYIWVEDLNQTWKACQALEQSSGQKVIHEAHHAANEKGVEAVVALALSSPSGATSFVVNEAPRGFVQQLSLLGAQGSVQENPAPARTALLQVTCEVPHGTVAGIGRFYRHFLHAAVMMEAGKCTVYFSPGESLTQALTFMEAEEEEARRDETELARCCEICIYMPSPARFSAALEACSKANVASCGEEVGGDLTDVAERTGEFRIRGCIDPESGEELVKLEHTIRIPAHPECLIPSSPQSSPREETAVGPHRVVTLAEVARHKSRSDAWIAINGSVYDVTEWISRHPGGVHAIMNRVGTDASDEWNMIHKPGTVERYQSRPYGPKLVGALEAEV